MSPEPFFPLLDRLSEEQFAGGYWSFPEYVARVREEAEKLSEEAAAEVVAAWLAARGYPRDRLPSALLRAHAQGPRARKPAEREAMVREAEQRTKLLTGIGLLFGGKIIGAIGFSMAFREFQPGRPIWGWAGLGLCLVAATAIIYGCRALYRLAFPED